MVGRDFDNRIHGLHHVSLQKAARRFLYLLLVVILPVGVQNQKMLMRVVSKGKDKLHILSFRWEDFFWKHYCGG